MRANRAAASIPFGAFAPHLPRTFRSAQGEADTLRQAAQAVLAGAGTGRLLLIVDDAHELDDASAALVHVLAESRSVFLVVTVRAGVAGSPPVTALWKDELLERIEVPALDVDASAELVETALGGPVDGGTALGAVAGQRRQRAVPPRAHHRRGDAGALTDVGGLWRMTGALAPSTRLGEVVGLRLGRLSEEEREAVELVAVGEPVSLDDLVSLVSGRCIDDLERRALVEVQVEHRRRQVRMAHPLYGEVVRAGLPERRRQELLSELADRLESHGARRREDVLRIAVWRLDGGGLGRPEVLLAAARQAHAAQDLRLMVRLAEAAAEAGAGVEAAHVLGVGLDGLGEHERAEEVLRDGQAAATTPRQRADLSIARADNLFRGLGRAEDAERIIEDAERTLDDPADRDGLVALRALFLLFEGKLRESLEVARPLLEEGTTLAYAQGGLAAAVALALSGRTSESIEIAPAGRRGPRGDGGARPAGQPGRVPGRRGPGAARGGPDARGHRVRRSSATRARSRSAPRTGRPGSRRFWGASSCTGAGRRARRAGAGRPRWCGASCATRRPGGASVRWPAPSPWPVTSTTPTTRSRSSTRSRRPRCSCSIPRSPGAGPGSPPSAASTPGPARSSSMRPTGPSVTARSPSPPARSTTWPGSARRGLAADRLAVIAPETDGVYIATCQAHAEALRSSDGDGLDAASEAFEVCGAVLLACESASAAATLHNQGGLRRKATASAQHAAALLAECEGARPIGVVAHVPGVSLTRREREVAELAARNLTSREIAEQLVVSARTVENHLQRAYEKMGVRSRQELRDALARGDDDR